MASFPEVKREGGNKINPVRILGIVGALIGLNFLKNRNNRKPLAEIKSKDPLIKTVLIVD